ncbi:hypothetical protein BDZ97DRAFT_1794954 [Flammula alnicola]|nr:hypothetical protein BDZ97DRAFT_1794954 [Flammula alnicola]
MAQQRGCSRSVCACGEAPPSPPPHLRRGDLPPAARRGRSNQISLLCGEPGSHSEGSARRERRTSASRRTGMYDKAPQCLGPRTRMS